MKVSFDFRRGWREERSAALLLLAGTLGLAGYALLQGRDVYWAGIAIMVLAPAAIILLSHFLSAFWGSQVSWRSCRSHRTQTAPVDRGSDQSPSPPLESP